MLPTITVENLSVSFPLARYRARQTWVKETNQKTGGEILKSKSAPPRVQALTDINFSLKSGDRLALLGHNGAGKTTLLKALLRIYRPTGGRISVTGRITSMLDIHTGFDNNSTGWDNIRLKAMFMGVPKNIIEEKIDDVAAFSNLGEYLDLPLETYSSGMRARLVFSVATGFDPQILVMDEWLSAGDKEFREKASQRMKEFVEQADILVIASHSEKLLRDTCNMAIVLNNGHVAFKGSVEDAIKFRNR